MTAPTDHRIDVLIPVYNGARTVREAVGSILAQSVRDIVVHVVDDGSTDETPAILAEMAAADDRLRVHRQANGGIVDALNAGLSLCRAPYLARHDADDIADPHRFRVQLDYLEAHPDCVAVGANVRHIDAEGRPTGSVGDLPAVDTADPFAIPSREPYLIHPFLMVRRDAMLAVGGYRHVLHAEDTDLYWRLLRCGRLHNLPDLLGAYRLHEASISSSSLRNGRLAAVSAQLAAVSEQRRRADRTDLAFDKVLIERMKEQTTLADIVDTAATVLTLDKAERDYLELSASAKLIDLAAYRPYEPDMSDGAFIRSSLRRGLAALPREVRAMLSRQVAGTAARLVAKGRLRSGAALLSPELLLPFLYRLGLRLALPGTLRQRLRLRLVSRAPMK